MLAVKKFTLGGRPAVLFAGADARGLMYALLDAAEGIADAARRRRGAGAGAGGANAAANPADLLAAIREIEERPAVRDRALSVYTMHRGYWESRFYDERVLDALLRHARRQPLQPLHDRLRLRERRLPRAAVSVLLRHAGLSRRPHGRTSPRSSSAATSPR